jgi:hypothetical protein
MPYLIFVFFSFLAQITDRAEEECETETMVMDAVVMDDGMNLENF